MRAELVVKGRLWVRGSFVNGGIGVSEGKVVGVFNEGHVPSGAKLHDLSRFLIIPGLVDPHVHLRDMELVYKEDFFTGTSSAVAGGYTVVLDMPNTVPPTNNLQALEDKRLEARGKVVCDVGFHMGFSPNAKEVSKCLERGVFSVKLYPEDLKSLYDFGAGCLSQLREVGVPVYVHPEDQETLEKRRNELGGHPELSHHSSLRPPEAELAAIARASNLLSGFRVHFAHITLAESLKLLAGRDRSRVTFEVTPHHLALTDRDVVGSPAIAKVNPPFRAFSDAEALRGAVNSGEVEVIASDHAPHALSEKRRGVYDEVPPGFPSLETAFSVLFTLVSKGLLDLNAVISAMTEKPAKIFNITGKGRLERGYDADFFVFDPKAQWEVKPELFKSKAKFSPFEGLRLSGKVRYTYVRGVEVFRDGSVEVSPGYGKILERGRG